MAAFPNLKKKKKMKICYSDFYYCQKWENKEGYVYAPSRWAGILFPCMLPTKGDTQHIFSSRISSCSFSHPSRALQSLPTYFRGAFLYPAAWTPGIAWCLRVTSGRLSTRQGTYFANTHLFVRWPSLHLLTTDVLKHACVHPRQAAVGRCVN